MHGISGELEIRSGICPLIVLIEVRSGERCMRGITVLLDIPSVRQSISPVLAVVFGVALDIGDLGDSGPLAVSQQI